MKDSYVFYQDQLKGEYKEVFQQIQIYVNSLELDMETREEQLGMLLDTFLTAQEQGRSVYEITGDNIEKFCKSFCQNFGWKNSLLSFAERIHSWVKWIFVISVFEFFCLFGDKMSGKDINLWTAAGEFNIAGYAMALVLILLLTTVIDVIMRKVMFRMNRFSMKILNGVSIAFVLIASVVAVLVLMGSDKTNLLTIPSWGLVGICGIYLILYYILIGRKTQKREKVKFSDLMEFDTDLYESMDKEMMKRYQKKNKRLVKKGKPELSMEEYLDQEEERCRKNERLKYFYLLLPVVVIIYTASVSTFDGIWDICLYVLILAVIEYALMFGLWKLVKAGITQRRTWIVRKRSE